MAQESRCDHNVRNSTHLSTHQSLQWRRLANRIFNVAVDVSDANFTNFTISFTIREVFYKGSRCANLGNLKCVEVEFTATLMKLHFETITYGVPECVSQ